MTRPGDSPRAWEAVDGALALPLSPFCLNYCFVAVRLSTGLSSGGRSDRNAA